MNQPAEPSNVPSAGEAGEARAGLDRSLVGGLLWTAAAKWAGQILSWAVMLVLARLLSPADFGVVGMAAVYLGLVILISEFGFGTAVVTLRDLDAGQLRQMNALALALGVVAALASLALAQPVGAFFHSPRLPPVVAVMSLAFVLTGFQSVPYGALSRDLRFRLLAGINASAAAAQSVVTVALAFWGLGYWALVVGNLAKAALLSVLSVFFAPHGFAPPRLRSVRRVALFSWHVIVSRAAWYAYSNADFLVAGRFLGESALGVYTIAWNVASAPVEKVTNLLTGVAPPVFAAVQNRHEELRRYLVRMTEGLSLLTFPATVGIALTARDLVRFALGPKWLAATAPLELLAFYATLHSIVTLLPQLLVAVGETRFTMWWTVGMLVVLPPAFYAGSRWGAAGIAAGWVCCYPVLTLPLFVKAFRVIGVRARDYFRALWPAASSAGLMAVCVAFAGYVLPAGAASGLRLAAEVGTGVSAYTGCLALAHRQRALAFVSTLRSMRS